MQYVKLYMLAMVLNSYVQKHAKMLVTALTVKVSEQHNLIF